MGRPIKDPSWRHIVRGDGGWVVRRQNHGIQLRFGDARYGGQQAALEAAVAARDELNALIGPSDTRVHLSDRRSVTGVVGVSWEYYRRPNGSWRNVLIARWQESGRQHKHIRSLRERRGGLDAAWWECVSTRAKGLGLRLDMADVEDKLERFRAFYESVVPMEHRI